MSTTTLSARAQLLAVDLRDLAGRVPTEVWTELRPLANEAEAIGEDLERSEAFEATVLMAAGEEVSHGKAQGPAQRGTAA